MKGFTVKCPICGTLNKSLFLEETEGTYECERCGHTGLIGGYQQILVHDSSIKNQHVEKDGHKKHLKLQLV